MVNVVLTTSDRRDQRLKNSCRSISSSDSIETDPDCFPLVFFCGMFQYLFEASVRTAFLFQ